MSNDHATAEDLLRYVQASPTPWHCVAETGRRLQKAGFSACMEKDAWTLEAGGAYFVTREGALIAFVVGKEPASLGGVLMIGAHTDSPNLRIKPLGSFHKEGYRQLGIEIYGSALTYSWLDRDLGLAGSVCIEGEERGQYTTRLLELERPLLRIPSLAIHLNRKLDQEGLRLNAQDHLAPVIGLTREDHKEEGERALRELLAEELKTAPETILSWDLALMDLLPPTIGGANKEFIFSPRLDNQAMCHAALEALIRTRDEETAATRLICLYDHEEVGSGSTAGAGGSFVEDILRRITEIEGPGAKAGGLTLAVPRSHQISADMAHAVHPNYQDRHDPHHLPRINGGPVLKINAQQRYATNAEGAAMFELLCRQSDVPCQRFVSRSDLPCGSTIGPIAAARLGIPTTDVGNPMLSMHSIREQAGTQDPERMTRVMRRFLEFK